MPKHRTPYPPEFRRQMLELVRVGRTPEELEEEYEPTAQTIRNRMAQDDFDTGRRKDGPTTEERAEIAKLRRENRVLREERDILKEAAAWFARETVPNRSSSS